MQTSVGALTRGEAVSVCPKRDQLQLGGECWREGLANELASELLREMVLGVVAQGALAVSTTVDAREQDMQ